MQDGPGAPEQGINLVESPLLLARINYINEVLGDQKFAQYRDGNNIANAVLAGHWLDTLKIDLKPACERAVHAGQQFAQAIQFADAKVSTDIAQPQADDAFVKTYLEAFDVRAKKPDGGAYLVYGGLNLKAIISDPDFPRISGEQYKQGTDTEGSFIVVDGDRVVALVASTKIPGVQMVLNGEFPQDRPSYLIQPELRIKLPQEV